MSDAPVLPASPEPATVSATAPPGGTATAVSSPALAVVKTVEHNDASALPEIGWLWRRVFIFSVSYALLFLLWRLVEIRADAVLHKMIAQGAIGLLALGMLLYLAGAGAEAITRLVGAIRTTRRETITERPAGASAPSGDTPAP